MPELPREGFGYISRQAMYQEPPAYRQCAWYDRDDKEVYFDSMWNAGKAMALLACGVGGIVMCAVLCTCCVAFELPTFDGLFWTCLVCFVAQALTFLSWGSDLCTAGEYECTWSSGTGMNITAAMFWVWAANMIKSFPEALPPRQRGRRNTPGSRRRPFGRGQNNTDDDFDNDDSPYLPASQRGGFEDEYDDGDAEYDDYYGNGEGEEEVDFDYDEGDGYGGYYDEDGNWVDGEDQQPNGYYDEDGNWHDYEDGKNDATGDDGYEGYGDDGYYDENGQQEGDGDGYGGEQQGPVEDDGYGDPFSYDDPSTYHGEPSPEELEFTSFSQRSINQLD